MHIRILILICFLFNSIRLIAQPTPTRVNLSLVESIGEGCGQLSEPSNGLVCFDVVLEIDVSGWQLRSYNIWIDYGEDSTVFSYASDASCHHQDGGDVDEVNEFGKYRFLAANRVLDLGADTPVVIHNYCLKVVDASRAHETPITPGGEIFGLLSSMNLVNSNSQSAINPEISMGAPVIVDLINSSTDIITHDIQISPNPFYQNLQILAEDQIRQIQIFDLKGQLKFSVNQLNTNEIEVNTSSLDAGFYVVHIKSATDVYVKKLLKAE